jgi:hypothetical protein
MIEYDINKDGAASYELAMKMIGEKFKQGECLKSDKGRCIVCGKGKCRIENNVREEKRQTN